MPLSEFQRLVLTLLKAHRNPNSYVAGGIAVNRASRSGRVSNDIDFFHDIDEAVSLSARADIDLLHAQGFKVQMLIEQPSFWRAVVARGDQSLKLEWVRDTAFRFFPVIEDDILGYRMHDIDLVVNKCLTLANRNEVRDIIDLIQLHQTFTVGGACWAACGKDPGFTPDLLVDCMQRNSIIRPEMLAAEALTEKIVPHELKRSWLTIISETRQLLAQLPPQDLGCIYVDLAGRPISINSVNDIKAAQRHFGSIGGSWPRVAIT